MSAPKAAQVEKLLLTVATVAAGVLAAGYIMSKFSTNKYVAQSAAGFKG